MKHLLRILFCASVIAACSSGENENPGQSLSDHEAFFNKLAEQCGSTWSGSSTYPDEEDHPLVGTELRVEINECDENHVRMELYRDGDYWHGAWVVEMREDGLHLFHDHLGTVRTPDDLGEDDYHGYGGYADDSGDSLTQYFPADDDTAEMIPAAATNVWMISILPEEKQLIYYLERDSAPRFRAVFTETVSEE